MSHKGQFSNIILIGLSGTGKSTVSELLAQRLNYRLVDIDAEIVRTEQRPIVDIFAEDGEAYFRQAECDCLCRVVKNQHQIIATGAGAVLRPDNCEAMLAGGLVVALTASLESIVARIQGNTERPLLAGNVEEKVRRMMEERKDAYRFAHVTIDTEGRSAAEVASDILTQYRV
ncbi:Shikimate kinase [compost metagenome]